MSQVSMCCGTEPLWKPTQHFGRDCWCPLPVILFLRPQQKHSHCPQMLTLRQKIRALALVQKQVHCATFSSILFWWVSFTLFTAYEDNEKKECPIKQVMLEKYIHLISIFCYEFYAMPFRSFR
jgi:hypothetical protein